MPLSPQIPNRPMLASALLRPEQEKENGETTTLGRCYVSGGAWAPYLVVPRRMSAPGPQEGHPRARKAELAGHVVQMKIRSHAGQGGHVEAFRSLGA